MNKNFQTIVIGLGAMGSVGAYQLAKRGNKFWKLTHSHHLRCMALRMEKLGSRDRRQATEEGEEYVPLVLRSYEIWGETEKATGKQILTMTGGLIMMSVDEAIHHGSHFFKQTVSCAENTAFVITCWMSRKSKNICQSNDGRLTAALCAFHVHEVFPLCTEMRLLDISEIAHT